MHFILNKPVFRDHLDFYVIIFQSSLGRFHKTGLTVFMKFTKIHDLGKKLGRCQWNCWLPIGKQKYNGKG